jgi:ubiquitin-conjugating enzyme E2 D/E
LKNNWSAALTVSQLLLTICALLIEGNPEDPLEPDIAQHFIRDRQAHDMVAKEWTRKYACQKI